MKRVFYRQCELHSRASRLVAWIDEASANVGSEVLLKDPGEPGRWWEVATVGATRLSAEVAERRQREQRKLQRKLG